MEPDLFGKTAPGRRALAEFVAQTLQAGAHTSSSAVETRPAAMLRSLLPSGRRPGGPPRRRSVADQQRGAPARQTQDLSGGTPPCFVNHAGLFPFAPTVQGTMTPDQSAAALLTRFTGHRHQQDPGRRRDMLTHTPPRMSRLDTLGFAVPRKSAGRCTCGLTATQREMQCMDQSGRHVVAMDTKHESWNEPAIATSISLTRWPTVYRCYARKTGSVDV